METIIDSFRKRDWAGFGQALLEAAGRFLRELAKGAVATVRLCSLAWVVGVGLYYGVTTAAKFDALLPGGEKLIYVIAVSDDDTPKG